MQSRSWSTSRRAERARDGAEPKLEPTTAQALIVEAQGVIDCINAISPAQAG